MLDDVIVGHLDASLVEVPRADVFKTQKSENWTASDRRYVTLWSRLALIWWRTPSMKKSRSSMLKSALFSATTVTRSDMSLSNISLMALVSRLAQYESWRTAVGSL